MVIRHVAFNSYEITRVRNLETDLSSTLTRIVRLLELPGLIMTAPSRRRHSIVCRP